MGSLDKKANSTSTNLGPEFPDDPLVITDRTLGSALGKYSPLVLDLPQGYRQARLSLPLRAGTRAESNVNKSQCFYFICNVIKIY